MIVMLEHNPVASRALKPYLSLRESIDAGEALRRHLNVYVAIPWLPFPDHYHLRESWISKSSGEDEVAERKRALYMRLPAATESLGCFGATRACIDA